MDLKNDIKMVTVKFSIYWRVFKASCLLFSMLGCILIVKAQPGSINEPVRFIGNIKVDFSRPDGALPPVIGAHSYQVLRSVKESKDLGDGLGFTFHHHPMLAYWKNQFYVLCNACPTHEERGQTEILLMKSRDGIKWEAPEIIFPHVLYNDEPTFSNHRIGFYLGVSGRLYASTAYFPKSEVPSQTGSEDTNKKYFGVVLREIKEDGSFGKIYFVAQNNSLYTASQFPFPYYTQSEDSILIQDCNTLREDPLLTLNWWEQIRPEDFKYPISLVNQINHGNRKFAKAISYFHRKDSAIVALWKDSKSAISYDEGKSWSKVTNLKTFSDGYAKVWAQKTNDQKYAASWRPIGEGSWGRYPMLWATSDDGVLFDNAMHVNGEVVRRYEGGSKDIGPCNYQRGLDVGSSKTPGDEMWIVYSMSKEDIWISSMPVPLNSKTSEYVEENFNSIKSLQELSKWNIYSPKWAPIRVGSDLSNQYLEFFDEDPYDYAKVFKVFKETTDKLKVSFKLLAKQDDHGRFEIEIGNTGQLNPIRISLTEMGRVILSSWEGDQDLGAFNFDEWLTFKLDIDVSTNSFNLTLNQNTFNAKIFNSKKLNYIDRITFRTGLPRGISINPIVPNTDLPLKLKAVFYLDDVKISN
jgi:hypothetical protein